MCIYPPIPKSQSALEDTLEALGSGGDPGQGAEGTILHSSDMAAPSAALLLALFAVYIHTSEAIHCFVCSSDVDRSCGDPFNTTSRRFLVSDCERDRSHTPYLKANAVCRKFTHKVNDEMVVVRSCAWGSESDVDGPCSASILNYARKLESCSTCNTDECNSAPSLASLSMMIALPFALLVAKLL